MNERKNFKIGIAMAGAVSAGAYTAGVMDYLLETLEKWEKAKAKNREIALKFGTTHPDYDRSLPMHDVIIEVIGGSSAGGMTAAITTLAAFEGINPINDNNPEKKNNNLYDCWVNLNDQTDTATLQQMLDCADISAETGVASLLNSAPIDAIADKAAKIKQILPLPPYLSQHLQIILTITSLRGVPISLKFSDQVHIRQATTDRSINFVPPTPPQDAHCMKLHKGIAHFQLNGDADKHPHTLPFDPKNQYDRYALMECAKATCAFPLGLRARLLKNTRLSYIKAMVLRMFSQHSDLFGDHTHNIQIDTESDPFEFVAVDGGTVNNEPFGEVMRVLEEKCNEEQTDYSVIMIDPFPNVKNNPTEKVKQPSHLLQLVPSLIAAIRGQAMVKENDILRALSSDYTLRIIFPSKNDDLYPIACGALDGFGGFFSREFREHDFQLGRKNGQSFLRKYFTIKLEDAKNIEIFSDWQQDNSDPRHQRFFIPKDAAASDGYYPIIPDLDVKEFYTNNILNELKAPIKPKISAKKILDLEGGIDNRFKAILKNILQRGDEEEAKTPLSNSGVEKLITQHFRQNFLGRQLSNSGLWLGKQTWRFILIKRIANYCTQQVLQTVLRDFDKRGLLDIDAKN